MTDSYVLGLVRSALEDIERNPASISTAFRRAIRIARLRQDWQAVYWLSMELETKGDPEVRRRRLAEITPHFSNDELRAIHERELEESLRMRRVVQVDSRGRADDDKVTGLSVPELEDSINQQSSLRSEPVPSNLHPQDAAAFYDQARVADRQLSFAVGQLTQVRARLLQRVHSYLSIVESQLARGQQRADYFDHNRQFVDRRLAELCPIARLQLREALDRALIDTPESRSHALTSCRRVLKSLADTLYPARSTPVIGGDGKQRVLDDAKYVSRLWQFLAESDSGRTARQQMQAELERLGDTIDRLNGLSSKGVHDRVTSAEVNICVTGLYGVVGTLLRIYDHKSATSVDPDKFAEA